MLPDCPISEAQHSLLPELCRAFVYPARCRVRRYGLGRPTGRLSPGRYESLGLAGDVIGGIPGPPGPIN